MVSTNTITIPTLDDYQRYADRLDRVEKLLHRHMLVLSVGSLLIVANVIGVLVTLNIGITPGLRSLFAVGMMLSLGCLFSPYAHAGGYHIKAYLLLERIKPPGNAHPLPRDLTTQSLNDSHVFIDTVTQWIDKERERIMLEKHRLRMIHQFP